MSEKHKFYAKLIFSILLMFAFSAALQIKLGLTIEDMRILVSQYGNIAPIAYCVFLFLGLSIPFNPVPDYALVITASLLLMPTEAITATFIAHSLALTINYFVGKKIGFKAVDIIAKKSEMEMLIQLSKKITPKQIFLFRWILPITGIGVDLVSYAAGMTKINFSKYFLVSIIPWTVYNIIFFTLTSQVRDASAFYVLLVSAVLISVSAVILKTVSLMFKSQKY